MIKSRTLALAAILSPALAGPSHAAGSIAEGAWGAWNQSAACLNSDATDLTGGARCIGDRMAGALIADAARLMFEQGRETFGENFRLVHQMTWSPFGSGLAGELDMVIPLAATGVAHEAADSDVLHGSAFFLQHGVTRWTDRHGLRHNDLRLGTAFRFTLPSFVGEDVLVLGVSALVQENVERGHQRVVFGTDYVGRWGKAALHHYIPTTSWRSGRSGYEERAIGGTELSLRLDATSTLSFDTSVGRWERDASGRSTVDGRLGIGWKPHPYFRLDAGTGIGPDADSGSFLMSINVPFGGSRETPRWEGLGTFGMADGQNSTDMWRPVESVGRIRTVERRDAQDDAQMGGVSARFLQSSAPTGDEIGVEVSLSAPATEDVRVSVRLVPGGGDNPAVPGVDYVDEPVIVTIPEGDTSRRVAFQLLDNPALDTDRTLDVEVTYTG